jgi:hypothetical protein
LAAAVAAVAWQTVGKAEPGIGIRPLEA